MMQKFKNFLKKLKKRKILMSVGLSWKLVFGQADVGYAQSYIFNSKSRVVQEKIPFSVASIERSVTRGSCTS